MLEIKLHTFQGFDTFPQIFTGSFLPEILLPKINQYGFQNRKCKGKFRHFLRNIRNKLIRVFINLLKRWLQQIMDCNSVIKETSCQSSYWSIHCYNFLVLRNVFYFISLVLYNFHSICVFETNFLSSEVKYDLPVALRWKYSASGLVYTSIYPAQEMISVQ